MDTQTRTDSETDAPKNRLTDTFMFWNTVNTAAVSRTCSTVYKKLSYRRGTAQRAVSVETVRSIVQMFIELDLIIPATGE